MAISFVQSKSAIGVGNVPVTFTSNNTAGNFIVMVGAAFTGSGSFTLNDTQNNSYFTVIPFANNATGVNAQIFFAANIKAGANTVTFSPGAAANSIIAVHEFSGIDTIDTLASSAGVGNAQTSTGATTVQRANELLFGVTMGSPTGVLTISNGAGFTLAESNVATLAFLTQWQIVSALGTYSSDTTTTVGKGGSYDWGAEIETFYSSAVVSTVKTFVTGFGF